MRAAPLTEPSEAADQTPIPRVWSRHLLAFFFPAQATLFLATGPHPWWVTPAFMIPLIAAHTWDLASPAETRQPARGLPRRGFDTIVYALGLLHLANVALLVRLFTQQSLFSLDFLFATLIGGGSAGYAIITAHELIHRPPLAERLYGRLLLCSVLYEHFYTEHVRGHHVRVGLPDDPATARFGESFNHFFRRTVPAQFRSAWRLETTRLGDPEMRLLDLRQLGNRVLHGLLVEWGIALGVLAGFGLAPFVAYLAQAYIAIRLLEIVNYFEHWGLTRRDPRRPSAAESWDTHSRFTYYGLIGLSRHADHHQFASRPYQELRVWEEPPILPRGYVSIIPLVDMDNREFQRLAIEELRRKRLGPFAVGPAPRDPSLPSEEGPSIMA